MIIIGALGLLIASCEMSVGSQGLAGLDGRDGEDGQVEIYSGTFTIDSDNDFGEIDEYISIASYSWDVLDVSTVDDGVVLATFVLMEILHGIQCLYQHHSKMMLLY